MKKPLSQKDLDKLEPKEKAYLVPLGEPKQLYIKIHPSGKKVFQIREQRHKVYISIGEYVKEIFSLADAREEAILILRKIREGEYVGNEFKDFTLEKAFEYYLETIGQRLSSTTIKKLECYYNKYIAPTLSKVEINKLNKQSFIPIFDLIYKKNLQETLIRTISF
ncbi:Arm DNA-binding domain-containing protein [Campylobacter sp. VTCC 70190]|uniref:Arm DNA-binding domain-containing protein n=1 Tax=Campylobacter sp. VTCC 70190 TaxID=3392118 RepID=UPI00398F8A4E